MIDEIFDRSYQSGRAHLNDGIDQLASRIANAVGNAFRVLNRVEYDAPWLQNRRARDKCA